MKQTPRPGDEMIRYCGDIIVFELDCANVPSGTAFLRTNLGRAKVHRQEVIAATEEGETVLSRDWHDIKMKLDKDSSKFRLSLPLTEPGCFEAKAFVLPEDGRPPVWMPGHNTRIKVEPSDTVTGNTMYTVFPRQFGAFKDGFRNDENLEENIKILDDSGYTVIPPSGTFRDVIKQLDFIIKQLGCRYLQLLPIHPTPTVYGRMGRYGSPYAVLDFFAVDPALAEFDKSATPLEQFIELVDAVHGHKGKVLIDIPVDHTGWASRLQSEHPQYFVRNEKGEFASPGAWGVIWADLVKLDYDFTEIHGMMADIFLYWCSLGVDGFRCDAGYMLPASAWKYITAKVREQYPDTLFLLEGLGGPVKVMEELLCSCGLNWAYSELFQNYSRDQIQWYLPDALKISESKGLLVNFSETHDNSRLAAKSHEFARLRTALCALASPNGAFGFANGVEWYASEQINVHGAKSLNWGNDVNMIDFIRRLNALLYNHICFGPNCRIRLLENHGGNSVALLREASSGEKLLVFVNLDDELENEVIPAVPDLQKNDWIDLLSGNTYNIEKISLHPGQVLCLSIDKEDMPRLDEAMENNFAEPARCFRQRARDAVLKLLEAAHGFGDVSSFDIEALVDMMLESPEACCEKISGSKFPPLVRWTNGIDQRREVMVPPNNMVLLHNGSAFNFSLKDGDMTLACGSSLKDIHGGSFAFIPPLPVTDDMRKMTLNITTFQPAPAMRSESTLFYLPGMKAADVKLKYHRSELRKHDLYALCANHHGAMAQIRGDWGEIRSKYDALLAANCNGDFPVDRTVMLTRCRGWLVCNDYSQELSLDCLEYFTSGKGRRAEWKFHVPTGQGKYVSLLLGFEIDEEQNLVSLNFARGESNGDDIMADNIPAKLILRPDIEARCNHEVTKAFTGPEKLFAQSVKSVKDGFDFKPYGNNLSMRLAGGKYIEQPEWKYMAALPVEAERGLESSTDLFSPGYFEIKLNGGDSTTLYAAVDCKCPGKSKEAFGSLEEKDSFENILRAGIMSFVVKRDDLNTVIAGYPWFLDWGRDTLICLRGMIAAGMLEESRAILKAFACFEKNGTIPNMIRGGDDSNRDTSDAPLWLFTAVADYVASGGHEALHDECGKRSLLEVLVSIAENIIKGTPNGIYMDKDSGLVFSPPHYTWMDTNYPAGTPRQGYPVEIQALWHNALRFLTDHADASWQALADKVKASINNLYVLPEHGFLSDCLHCEPGTPASEAKADDACRCNQLLTLTLGAVTELQTARTVIRSCEQLLVPGAIRSLADLPVKFHLRVEDKGQLLNDPAHPYWGEYLGDEDTRRKAAYHNGTAWTWPFPSYCEALYKFGGKRCRTRALAILLSARKLLQNGIPGQIPEIIDGNAPHAQRGCGAQAWGVTELFRVYNLIKNT